MNSASSASALLGGLKAFLPADQLTAAGWWPMGRMCILAAITLTTLLLIKTVFPTIRGKLPPGPKPLPIIGNLHQIMGQVPHQRLWSLAQKHGPIMYLHMGAMPLVIASSAEVAQEFLKVHDKAWANRPPAISAEILTNNYRNIAWAPYGPYWRHLRKICALELFTPKRLEFFRPARTEEYDEMVRSVYDNSARGEVVELTVKLSHLATNNITRMLFNKRLFGSDAAGQLEARRFKKLIFAFFTASSAIIVGDFIPWLKWVTYASGFVAHIRKVKAELDAFLQEFLEVKKDSMKSGACKIEHEQFVDVLLAQPDENGTGHLQDDSIKGVITDVFVAGTDTSSNTVEWAIAELIRHPKCMDKLQGELDAGVGRERVVAEADIAHLPYLQAVVKEVLRLYPPGPLSTPHASSVSTTVCGYELPAGTQLFVNLYAIHRDPKVWPNPLQFDPDRFIRNPGIDVRGHHFQLMPFGAGRRQCPGMELGLLFVQTGLARLAQGFTFLLPDGQDPRTLDMSEKYGATMPRATPLRVIAKPRLGTHLYLGSRGLYGNPAR